MGFFPNFFRIKSPRSPDADKVILFYFRQENSDNDKKNGNGGNNEINYV